MRKINDLQGLISSELETLRFGNHPKELYEPISYILSLGGKRLRPLLVLLGYLMEKEEVEEIIRPALTVEVFHNFTLMHDDIMDQAPLRRGEPTVHEKWNSTVAILSGDTMLVKAYDLLLEVDKDLLPEAIRMFNQCAVEVCEGQQIDMNFESQNEVSEAEYIEMIRLKTAVLLGFSLSFGGLMAGMKPTQQQQLYDIGVKMGIGFQLMDDLLDVYADQAKFGKQVGGDIVSNKKTFLLITALNQADANQKARLEKWLSMPEFVTSEKVEAVKSVYDELNIFELTTAKMNAYFDEAFQLLDDLKANEQGKSLLREFAKQLMKREN